MVCVSPIIHLLMAYWVHPSVPTPGSLGYPPPQYTHIRRGGGDALVTYLFGGSWLPEFKSYSNESDDQGRLQQV